MRFFRLIALAAAMSVGSLLYARQNPSFEISTYKQFLSTHQNLETAQLLALYPAGVFGKSIDYDPLQAAYFENIDSLCHFTPDERLLLEKHGFVVSERLSRNSFGDALLEIYRRDLPVFVSTDAILHALHKSYDVILKSVECSTLIPELDTLLAQLHSRLPVLASTYTSIPAMKQSLNDVDVYLCVARNLLGGNTPPAFSENSTDVTTILSFVEGLQPVFYSLFSSEERTIDFSQFKIRGHYTQEAILGKYFQAMIWLGRTEMYLISPRVDGNLTHADSNIQRQAIDALLILEALEDAQQITRLNRMDQIIQFFVGESDNVTVSNLQTLWQQTGMQQASDLLDTTRFKQFQEALSHQSYASQRILSQIFITDPLDPDQIKPASAFLLLGQRFVIDSYVTGNVVYDRIVYNNNKITRMLPTPLDVLFALGNSAAAQLLQPELDRFHYGTNLAALRYLVDSYDEQFWKSTLYNAWLHSIRALNAPGDRRSLPVFMQTAAWWQEKMNTQLAAWAQLRHDNLLYAKQSYSGGIICSFPESYVEPVPAFYAAVKTFAEEAAFKLESLAITGPIGYFRHFGGVADTLYTIASKTLSGTIFSLEEKEFLKRMLRLPEPMCGAPYGGWYTELFYQSDKDMFEKDRVVADIHTAPTDELGNPIGWVLHVGTGPINLAVVTAPLPDGELCAFVGPVMSYYEYLSTNFRRLTDEEWKTLYAATPSARPLFTNLYLADSTGTMRDAGLNLVTEVGEPRQQPRIPLILSLAQNYPNPFNPVTVIEFTVPSSGKATLKVFDMLGREVATVLHGEVEGGRLMRTIFNGHGLASGVYAVRLEFDGKSLLKKMLMIK